ncbi:hypothetical protein [Pelagicoccus sp. SDUM812003]|uniref:hypothetical protein n=1 Tax=Pelagicoccus sp. SDUM812003 TaxID=3041267 RepID=UPI00280D2C63|nr:hypothetical protein [Pelagicoccus sp. SDUM812003]MDQ8205818.1 hypothetical protein [Pelagicoccus sp. SDUM812003]
MKQLAIAAITALIAIQVQAEPISVDYEAKIEIEKINKGSEYETTNRIKIGESNFTDLRTERRPISQEDIDSVSEFIDYLISQAQLDDFGKTGTEKQANYKIQLKLKSESGDEVKMTLYLDGLDSLSEDIIKRYF